MKKIVIAGAAGFIASHLVDYHLHQGDEVIGLDNFSTGKSENLAHLAGNSHFRFIECDVSLPLPELPMNADVVYHMASPASPPRYMKLSLETMKVNSVGTENLLEYSLAAGARFLFASTSEVYGDPEVHPQVEEYWGNVNPIGPRSVYDEAKRYGEALVSLYRRDKGADTVLIRIFNTYGPRMDPFDGRVVTTFLRQMIAGEPISMFGDGQQTRSFCFVDDLVRGIVAAAESDISGPVNLGNPNEMTLRELADAAAHVIGIEPHIEFLPLPVDDPKRRKPDISLAMSELGWKPEIGLDEGLRATADWMRALR